MRAHIRSIFEALFRRPGMEQRMDSELRIHIEAYTDDLVRSGVPRAEAERRSRMEFGSIEAVKDECREARGLRWPDELHQDLRYAFRSLRKAPGFAVAAILSLALGIGAVTAIFSVVNAALIRPLPYEDPGRLTAIYEDHTSRGARHSTLANANFIDLRVGARSFADIAAHTSTGLTLTGTAEAEQLLGRLVTANMFSLLGVPAQLGRPFVAEDGEPGRPRVILLSYALWQRKFAGSPAIVGHALSLNGSSYTVIGVMPATFRFPGADDEFWLPLRFDAKDREQRSNHNLHCIGRLKSGADLRHAQAEASFIARRLQRQYPDTNAAIDFNVVPLRESLTKGVRTALVVLLATVGLLLLIACANVGNLILTRSTVRLREMAVRAALGAGRWRLVRQAIAESLCLSSLGGAAALSICFLMTQALRKSLPPDLTPTGDIRIDGAVLCFGMIVSLAAGLLCAFAPVLLVAGGDPQAALGGSSRSATGSGFELRTRSLLVASEAALTVVLLIGAGLLLRSFVRLMDVDPGFRAGQVLVVRFALPQFLYPSHSRRMPFYQTLLDRMEAVHGVQSAALITSSPFTAEGGGSWFRREGKLDEHPEQVVANNRLVSEKYFSTLGIRLLQGRTFSNRDGAGAPLVAVINESMARRFWPGESPVGKRFQFYNGDRPWIQIVGVIGDVRQTALNIDPAPEIYRPVAQDDQIWLAPRALVIRTQGEPFDLAPSIRRQFQALDRDVPIYGLDSMAVLLEKSVASRRLVMVLVGVFGCVALLLAAVGVYAVVAYAIAQRTPEIGIRMAMGATGTDVVRMMLRKGLAPVLAGQLIGLGVALGFTRFLASQLYQVQPTDALTFSAVPVLMIFTAGCAAYFPSRRAARIDPMQALRHD
jgi:putative ABC transport system permease protein